MTPPARAVSTRQLQEQIEIDRAARAALRWIAIFPGRVTGPKR